MFLKKYLIGKYLHFFLDKIFYIFQTIININKNKKSYKQITEFLEMDFDLCMKNVFLMTTDSSLFGENSSTTVFHNRHSHCTNSGHHLHWHSKEGTPIPIQFLWHISYIAPFYLGPLHTVELSIQFHHSIHRIHSFHCHLRWPSVASSLQVQH